MYVSDAGRVTDFTPLSANALLSMRSAPSGITTSDSAVSRQKASASITAMFAGSASVSAGSACAKAKTHRASAAGARQISRLIFIQRPPLFCFCCECRQFRLRIFAAPLGTGLRKTGGRSAVLFRADSDHPGAAPPSCGKIEMLFYSPQYLLSRLRYWMASAMCWGRIFSSPARSAMVRATLVMRL